MENKWHKASTTIRKHNNNYRKINKFNFKSSYSLSLFYFIYFNYFLL